MNNITDNEKDKYTSPLLLLWLRGPFTPAPSYKDAEQMNKDAMHSVY